MDDNITDPARTARVWGELQSILLILSGLTGLPSNWNGELVLVPEARFKGKKLFSCGVLLDAALAAQEMRWRTLIHEALHSLSVGYNRMDYDALPGWEEGVVEQLQRLFRPQVLSTLGVPVNEDAFARADAEHSYNRYIRALEELRHGLSLPDVTFYQSLLATPIRNRPAFVHELAAQLPGRDRAAFTRTFAVTSVVLRYPG